MYKNTLKVAPVLVLAVMLTTGFGWLFDHHTGCCPTKTGDAYCPKVACPQPCQPVVLSAPYPVYVEKVVVQKPKKRVMKRKRVYKRVRKVRKVVDPVVYWPNPTCCPAATCPTPCPVACPTPCPKPCDPCATN